MKKATQAVLMALAMAGMSVTAQTDYQPEKWNLEAREQFAAQRFGIFIHWGLYANYAQGEWYLQEGKLDEGAYSRMKDGFYPSKFDAGEWIRVIKNSGAKYLTITSRHHDGFSLWPTKVDDGYNIMNTPFKRDILGELAKACREEGIQLNFSYKKFMMDQITELIDWYHPGNIWFDGEWEHAEHDDKGNLTRTLDWEFDDIYDLIHSKKTLVANNNHQAIRPKEDIQLFERDLPGENAEAQFSKHQPLTRDRPVEQCDVIQSNVWGYRIGETNFRTAPEVVALIARAASKDSNLLMNIGPDGSGQFPARAIEVLQSVGTWFALNGESIYGTRAGGVKVGKDIVSTRKGETLYLHFLAPQKVKTISFAMDEKPTQVKALATGEAVPFTYEAKAQGQGELTITIAPAASQEFDYVVEVK